MQGFLAPSPTLLETGLAPGCEAFRSRSCHGEGPLVQSPVVGAHPGAAGNPPCLSRAGPGVPLFEGGSKPPFEMRMPSLRCPAQSGVYAERRLGREIPGGGTVEALPSPGYPGHIPLTRRRWPAPDWVGQRVEVGWSPEGGWVPGPGGWGVVGFPTAYAYGPPFLRNPSAPKKCTFFYLD